MFASKRGNRIKVLWFDHNGYCLLYKRLHRALFELPPSGGAVALQLNAAQLATLLRGSPRTARRKIDRGSRVAA